MLFKLIETPIPEAPHLTTSKLSAEVCGWRIVIQEYAKKASDILVCEPGVFSHSDYGGRYFEVSELTGPECGPFEWELDIVGVFERAEGGRGHMPSVPRAVFMAIDEAVQLVVKREMERKA
jgi:hypothetical protein